MAKKNSGSLSTTNAAITGGAEIRECNGCPVTFTREATCDEREPILRRKATLRDAIVICVSCLVLFLLCMWDKVNVGFLFVPHMRFVSVAISVVIVRRIRQFVVGMKSRRLGKISAYEVSLSVIAILKFAGLPAG